MGRDFLAVWGGRWGRFWVPKRWPGETVGRSWRNHGISGAVFPQAQRGGPCCSVVTFTTPAVRGVVKNGGSGSYGEQVGRSKTVGVRCFMVGSEGSPTETE